jgi:hypothetical protein
MNALLQIAQDWVSYLANYLTSFSDSQRAGAAFVGAIILIYMSIKDRDVEYISIALGLGALLMFAYSLDMTFDFLR